MFHLHDDVAGVTRELLLEPHFTDGLITKMLVHEAPSPSLSPLIDAYFGGTGRGGADGPKWETFDGRVRQKVGGADPNPVAASHALWLHPTPCGYTPRPVATLYALWPCRCGTPCWIGRSSALSAPCGRSGRATASLRRATPS
eukprot:2458065-Prymnesium_polylepis.1